MNRYIAIKTSVSVFTGVMVTTFLWVLDVDFPVLWGLVALLLNFIPTIGSIIAGIPPVLLALVQLGPTEAGLVVLGFFLVNTIVGNILEPRYMGQGLGLSALVVFVSLIFWGWLFGPVGMLLSVPLTMSAKIALEANQTPRGSPACWRRLRNWPNCRKMSNPQQKTPTPHHQIPETRTRREPVRTSQHCPNARLYVWRATEATEASNSIPMRILTRPAQVATKALSSFATEQLRIYPQPDARRLRQAIAEHHNVSMDGVVVTHAGDEALRLASPPSCRPIAS